MKNKFLDIEVTNVILDGKEEDIILKIKNRKNNSNYLIILNNKNGEDKDIKICLYADDKSFESWDDLVGFKKI
ncbi:hypothetical protein IRT73_004488 [Salmonella enterica]|nr:hypothetical protein [Salmonella enterica]